MAKPKLALIPAAQGTKLYSVLPSNGTGDFDFTRGSVATRINAQGLIENVASGQSRLDYPMIDGVQKGCPHHILEPARTNLIQYSEDFSGYPTTNLNAISNQNISPNGSLNGTFLRPTTDNSSHQLYKTTSLTAGTNTLSSFIKAGNYSKFRFYFFDGTTAHEVYGDSSNGTIHSTNSSVKVENYGNGWYRYSITATNVNYSVGNYTIRVTDENYQDTWAGNGIDGLYIFGWQFEVGSFPTSYIPTTTTTVTRSAETASGAGNSTTFNDSEGCLMLEISRLNKADSSSEIISINDGSLSNYITLYYNSSGVTYTINFGSTERNGNFSMSANNQAIFNKIALKYKSQDVSLFVNGFEVDTNSGTLGLTGLNSLEFNHGNDAFDFYGKAKQIQYFDSILADTQLEQLTSWQSFRDMANGQLYTIE